MRAIYLGLLVTLFLAGCASVQDTHQESISFDRGFEETWQAAMIAVSNIGFTVRNTDKDSGIIYAQGGRNLFTQNEPPQMNIIVRRNDGDNQTTVTANAVQAGQMFDWGAGKGNTEDFLNEIRGLLQ